MYKVVYVNANFKPVGKNVTVEVPTGEKKKSLFGNEKDIYKEETQWQQTGYSDKEINGNKLTDDINDAISTLSEAGYEVVTVLPVISGNYNFKWEAKASLHSGWGYGYGYGYSYTEGVTIIARKAN